MKKFTKFIALTTAMTMLFGVVVYAGPSQTTTSNSSESKSAKTTTSAPSTTNTVATVAQDAKAPAPAYAAGVTASEGVAVAPVNAATVNYATLGAKLLVSPTAVVYKSVVLTGDAKNVTLNVAGLAKGTPVYVLAYDLATGTWKKISCKANNGKVTFKKSGYSIFSLVVDVVAP